MALPAMDSDPKQMPKCYAPAVHWSDYFWSLCFDRWVGGWTNVRATEHARLLEYPMLGRWLETFSLVQKLPHSLHRLRRLPAARAAKSETEQDFKLLLEQLLADLLEVGGRNRLCMWDTLTLFILGSRCHGQASGRRAGFKRCNGAPLAQVACLPEWPAASVLLLRFMTTLNGPRGLQHSGGRTACCSAALTLHVWFAIPATHGYVGLLSSWVLLRRPLPLPADGYVRQTCVDLLGQVAARLHQFHAATEGDADWLQQLAEAKGEGRPVSK